MLPRVRCNSEEERAKKICGCYVNAGNSSQMGEGPAVPCYSKRKCDCDEQRKLTDDNSSKTTSNYYKGIKRKFTESELLS